MPGGMVFSRHAIGSPNWDFDPGSRLLTLNDLRIDAETRQLILEMFELPDAELILEVADVLAGTGVTVTDNGNGTLTISMDPTSSPAFAEAVRDTMGAALDGGVGVTVTPNDPGDLLTITLDLTDAALLEAFRDAVGTMLTAGAGISVTVNDGADTITLASTIDAEYIRDTMGTALVAGGNVTITPSDVGDTITIAAALTGSAGDAEVIRDTIAAALTGGTGITVTPNDGADTIVVATTITQYTDENARDALGAALVGGSGINVVVSDGSDTITLSSPPDVPVFTVAGTLTVTAYTFRWYAPRDCTIGSVRASVGTQPTGAAVIVDVLKNGTTIFTGGTDRPQIAVSTNTDTGTPAVTAVSAGDYLTVSVSQIGSTIAGADLTVQVVMV